MQGAIDPRRLAAIGSVLALFAAGACSGMSQGEQRVLSGGAIGAAGGAAIGGITGGSMIGGALLGGAAGAAGGYLLNEHDKRR
jgi:hypothetical protein